MSELRERCHSFVALNAEGRRVVIDVFRCDGATLELATEDGVAVTRLGDKAYVTQSGTRLTSDDPEAR